MHARSKARQGFTLVEILIVVVILGILAAIVIPQFTSASEDARASSLVSQLQTIRSQMELFQIQNNGNYPTIPAASGEVWDEMTLRNDDNNTGPYLQQAPRNPFGPGDAGSVTVVDGLTELNTHNDTNWNYDPGTGQIKANLNITEDTADGRNLNFSDADVNYASGGGT